MKTSSAGVVAVLAAWFLIVLAVGRAGAFESGPSHPPLALLAAIVIPLLLFAAAYRGSSQFRSFVLAIDLRLLTAVQGWRVIGVMFLALYAFDLLRGRFAWPAGARDAAVGAAAPFVLMAMLRGAPTWWRQVFWLNIAGLVDFVGAVGSGVLTSNTPLGLLADGVTRASLGLLPLSLVPTFGVPLWIVFHVISLLQLRRLAAAAAQPSSTIGGGGGVAGHGRGGVRPRRRGPHRHRPAPSRDPDGEPLPLLPDEDPPLNGRYFLM